MVELTAPSYAQPAAGFRSRKSAQMCAYFALADGGTIEKLKLIKLIYLSERKFLSEYHHPMLFDELYSLPNGPICSATLNGIDGIIHDELWSEYIARNGNIVVAVSSLDRDGLNEVSDAEMDVISSIWDDFGQMTSSQIRNYTHEHCKEYTETEKARVPISYRKIFEALGEEDAAEIAAEIDEMVQIEGILSA